MIAAAQARQQLEQLGLTEAAAVLDGRLETAAQKQLPYADFLADLLGSETTIQQGAMRQNQGASRRHASRVEFLPA